MYAGRINDKPYLILCQQSQFDDSRAPDGKHTGYAYCHVPHGSTVDRTDAIESQIERFAPGFGTGSSPATRRTPRSSRHTIRTTWAARSPAASPMRSSSSTAPSRGSTPTRRRTRVCSSTAAMPPGGGVHGLSGYWAARSALKRLGRA